MPAELIDAALSYLAPSDLIHAAATCRILYTHATDDRLWQAHVQDNVPGQTITSSYPCASFRDLFRAHHPRWFLPKYKIWYSDTGLPGRMVVTRYDQRRGCIEGYQLVAHNTDNSFQAWDADNSVGILAFNPVVNLHLDSPVLRLPATSLHDIYGDEISVSVFQPQGSGADTNGEQSEVGSSNLGSHGQPSFQSEIRMRVNLMNRLQSSFVHARCLSPEDLAERSSPNFPYRHVWPPPTIPSAQHVLGAGLARATSLRPEDIATSRHEVNDRAFRIYKWIQIHDFDDSAVYPLVQPRGRSSSVPRGPVRLHVEDLNAARTLLMSTERPARQLAIGEEVSTYATLDPALYTPTPYKPFRGIWVGHYGAHGCEFLWVHQPDDNPDHPPFDPDTAVPRLEGESDEAHAARKRDAAVYRGRLEAVKLTGDVNVPRGEYSFVAEDLGSAGFVGVAEHAPFEGVRTVRCRGHIAENGFQNGEYPVLSPSRFWVAVEVADGEGGVG